MLVVSESHVESFFFQLSIRSANLAENNIIQSKSFEKKPLIETFGDRAILSNTTRQTSYTTVRTTEFLVIDSIPFLQAVSGFVDEETAHKMDLIRRLPVFRTLGNEDEVARVSGWRRFKAGKAVVVEGGRSESLFFIR